eukprot:gene13969-16988_t
MTPEQFKSEYRRKGWTGLALAERWSLSPAWISKLGNDPDREAHWDDAIEPGFNIPPSNSFSLEVLMYDVVIAREACFLDKSISRGEVVSVHRDMVAAMSARDKLNKRKRAIHSESAFIAVHSENALRKGDIVEQLIEDYDREQRRAFCKRLMAAILSMELTGKPDRLADDEHVLQQQEAAHLRARGYEAQKAIDMIRNEPCFSVPAVRGVQARGEFYLAQIPYPILAKLFVFDEEE